MENVTIKSEIHMLLHFSDFSDLSTEEYYNPYEPFQIHIKKGLKIRDMMPILLTNLLCTYSVTTQDGKVRILNFFK